jgi:hypothetical protein
MKIIFSLLFFVAGFQIGYSMGKCLRPLNNPMLDTLKLNCLKNNSGLKMGITPTALLNTFPGIQVNASYTIRHFGIDQEMAYIINNTLDEANYSGYRIRTVLKYIKPISDSDLIYIGIGYHLRTILFEEEMVLERYDGSYFQRMKIKNRYTLSGIPILVGIIVQDTEHFFWELALGLGRSWNPAPEPINLPDDASIINTSEFRPEFEEIGPLAIFHAKIQYRF